MPTTAPKKDEDNKTKISNSANQGDTEKKDFVKYFRSSLPGLAVTLSENDERDQTGTDEVRFEPYRFRDDKRGEWVTIGLLETDEIEAIDILIEDPNVTELSKKQYDDLKKDGQKVPY